MPVFSNNDSLIKTHTTVTQLAGNAVWIPEYTPKICSTNAVIEVLLRILYMHKICCVIAGDYPLYLANKIPTFNAVDIFIVKRVQHITRVKCFVFGTRKHIHINELCCILLHKQMFKIKYKITYRSVSVHVVLHSVFNRMHQLSTNLMSLNLLHYIWQVLPYKALCLGIVTLPDGQICYTYMYDAESGWGIRNPFVMDTNIVNARYLKSVCDTFHTTNKCSLCIKTPPSLKALASHAVFTTVFNVQDFKYVNNMFYSTFDVLTQNPEVRVGQLVPYPTPFTLVTHYALPDPTRNKRVHAKCTNTSRVWLGRERTLIRNANSFVNTVHTYRNRFWCALCNKPLFSIYKHGIRRLIREW